MLCRHDKDQVGRMAGRNGFEGGLVGGAIEVDAPHDLWVLASLP